MTPEQEMFVKEMEANGRYHEPCIRNEDAVTLCSIIRQQDAWIKRARPWLNAFIKNIEILEGTGDEIIVGHGTYKKLVELKQLLEEQPGGE